MVIVFDATTSAQSEAQRESLSEHVDVVYSAGGACFVLSLPEASSASPSVVHASHATAMPQELEQRTSSLRLRSGR